MKLQAIGVESLQPAAVKDWLARGTACNGETSQAQNSESGKD
jgi:hypothetical protein